MQNQQGNRPGGKQSGQGQGQNPMNPPKAGQLPEGGQMQEEEEEETGGRQEDEEGGSEIDSGRNGQSPGSSQPGQGEQKR